MKYFKSLYLTVLLFLIYFDLVCRSSFLYVLTYCIMYGNIYNKIVDYSSDIKAIFTTHLHYMLL
jgi:hypothetical protein